MSEINVDNLTHTFGKGGPEALTVLEDIEHHGLCIENGIANNFLE